MGRTDPKEIDSILKTFTRKFTLQAKAVTYAVLIPITTIAFIFVLDLSSAQKKYFVPIVIGVVVMAMVSSKFTFSFIMKRFMTYLQKMKNGEIVDETEMDSIRKNYARIPLLLAIDSGARWALGLFMVALGLQIIAPLTITSLITFFTVGFSNAFLGFLVYYIVVTSLIKELGPKTVYKGITTKSFQLRNRLSGSLTIMIVVIILFIASILTTVVYNLSYKAMQHAYENQMSNINRMLDKNIETSLDDLDSQIHSFIDETNSTGKKIITVESLRNLLKRIPAADTIIVLTTDGGISITSSTAGMNEKLFTSNKTFTDAVEKAAGGKSVLSGISRLSESHAPAVLFAVPAGKNSILCLQLKPEAFFSSKVKGIRIGENGYPLITDGDARLTGHPDDSLINTDLLTYSWGHLLKDGKNGNFFRYEWQKTFKMLTLTRNAKYNFIVAASAYYSDMEKAALVTTQTLLAILLIGSSLIGGALYIIIGRNLSYIRTIQKTIYSMAKGDISSRLDVTTADEIGAISADLNSFIEKLRSVVQSIKEMSSEFASSSDEMSATTLSFSDNAQSQAASAEEITATVEELSAGMDSISIGANDQNERLAGLIKEMKSLSQIITDMGNTIQDALRTTVTMSNNARAGDESLRSMNTIMAEITQSSKDMTGIVKIITDISTQINLLSLNAAIEAARAGESGRGFAVVADEISKLADETASSIKDIDRLISENNTRIEKGMSSVAVSIETISSIIESTNSIAVMMKSIGDFMQSQALLNSRVNSEAAKVKENSESIKQATEEHKIAIVDIVRSIGSINELTQSNAGGSEEMASNAKDLSTRAETLKNAIDFFKL